MRRGFHLLPIPGDGPRNGMPWAWRWVVNAGGERLGIAVVWHERALFCLWSNTAPLNTMRVVDDQ